MNVESLLFLLLPIAAASGWWLAKRNMDASSSSHRSDFSAEYFTGLNFLLNEQPDKAVDVFIKMLEVDNDTVETHLALGNLFRRRGEGDRAIRLHQNLIARPTLTKEQRAQALLELGKDYMRVGFLDRAENLFLELAENKIHRDTALDNLLDIYQQESDWEKAITISNSINSIDNVGSKHTASVSAQFCCELADQECSQGELKLAQKHIKKALAYDKKCVRANLLLGQIEQGQGNYDAAIKIFKQIEIQDPTYISEIVEPILGCFQALGQSKEAEAYLTSISNKYGGVTTALALAELTRLQKGEKAAAEKILTSLEKRPSIKGLEKLLELQVASSQGDLRENLSAINSVVNRLIERQAPYRCENCGFQGKTLHWQCPTCRSWNTVKPMQGDESVS